MSGTYPGRKAIRTLHASTLLAGAIALGGASAMAAGSSTGSYEAKPAGSYTTQTAGSSTSAYNAMPAGSYTDSMAGSTTETYTAVPADSYTTQSVGSVTTYAAPATTTTTVTTDVYTGTMVDDTAMTYTDESVAAPATDTGEYINTGAYVFPTQ